MTFPEYAVRRFYYFTDAKGEFARLIATDECLPASGELSDYRRHMRQHQTSQTVIRGLNAAWNSYVVKTFRKIDHAT